MTVPEALAFGERLRAARKRRGLSQRQLALATGRAVTAEYISRIESGYRAPSLNAIEKLAAGLDLDPAFLRTGDPGSVVIAALSVADVMPLLEAEGMEPGDLVFDREALSRLSERVMQAAREALGVGNDEPGASEER
jgi:transcriptional regulator with XRE-family HTH domain